MISNKNLPDPKEIGMEYKKRTTIHAVRMDEDFEVQTLEGLMKGKAGDWLARGVKGELYPIAADVFKSSYGIREVSIARRFVTFSKASEGYTWAICDMMLPRWWTKKHARLLCENKVMCKGFQDTANRIAGDLKLHVYLNFHEDCGLLSVNVVEGNGTSLGIDGASFREGSPNNHLSGGNIFNANQAMCLYSVWAHVLNAYEVMRDTWDKQIAAEKDSVVAKW